MDDELARLAGAFAAFAELEARGTSPAYVRLAEAVAAQPHLAGSLLAAPPVQRRPNLLFAATQYLLRTAARGHPLSDYYATLGGTREPDDHLRHAFADTPTLVSWRDGLPTVCTLGQTGPHGGWLAWAPGRHAYRHKV
jgi:hypothetical protein